MARELVRTEFSETVEDGTTSTIVEFTDDVSEVIVSIVFGAASTVVLETTTDLREDIGDDGVGATWFNSPYGDITSNLQVVLSAPNAIRIRNTGGNDVTWSIRGNR